MCSFLLFNTKKSFFRYPFPTVYRQLHAAYTLRRTIVPREQFASATSSRSKQGQQLASSQLSRPRRLEPSGYKHAYLQLPSNIAALVSHLATAKSQPVTQHCLSTIFSGLPWLFRRPSPEQRDWLSQNNQCLCSGHTYFANRIMCSRVYIFWLTQRRLCHQNFTYPSWLPQNWFAPATTGSVINSCKITPFFIKSKRCLRLVALLLKSVWNCSCKTRTHFGFLELARVAWIHSRLYTGWNYFNSLAPFTAPWGSFLDNDNHCIMKILEEVANSIERRLLRRCSAGVRWKNNCWIQVTAVDNSKNLLSVN